MKKLKYKYRRRRIVCHKYLEKFLFIVSAVEYSFCHLLDIVIVIMIIIIFGMSEYVWQSFQYNIFVQGTKIPPVTSSISLSFSFLYYFPLFCIVFCLSFLYCCFETTINVIPLTFIWKTTKQQQKLLTMYG